jgi:hypothetical protein
VEAGCCLEARCGPGRSARAVVVVVVAVAADADAFE